MKKFITVLLALVLVASVFAPFNHQTAAFERTDGLWIDVDPNSRTIVNAAGNISEYTITVGNMPPNTTLIINPDPPTADSITVSGLPPGIIASGSVTSNAQGIGTGIMTLTIVTPIDTAPTPTISWIVSS